jgi:hypothetical protein
VIPDVLAKRNLQLIAVEVEPDTIPDSWNHALGQAQRFRSFADIVYVAFPSPIPSVRVQELERLNSVLPRVGLLEVDSDSGTVTQYCSPEENKPADPSLRLRLWRELDIYRELGEARLEGAMLRMERQLAGQAHHQVPLGESRQPVHIGYYDTYQYDLLTIKRLTEIDGDPYGRFRPRLRILRIDRRRRTLWLRIDDPVDDLIADALMLELVHLLSDEITHIKDYYDADYVKVCSSIFKYCENCQALAIGACHRCEDALLGWYFRYAIDEKEDDPTTRRFLNLR